MVEKALRYLDNARVEIPVGTERIEILRMPNPSSCESRYVNVSTKSERKWAAARGVSACTEKLQQRTDGYPTSVHFRWMNGSMRFSCEPTRAPLRFIPEFGLPVATANAVVVAHNTKP